MIEELQQIGLTTNECKVYLALINHGVSLAGTISRKTGLHRRSVYDITEMLVKKGLIGYIVKNNRRYFEAVHPQKILDIIKEKENILSPLVNELTQSFESKKEKQETNFYKGKDGLKTIFEEQLNHKEIFILGASTKAYEILQFYFIWYDKKRKKLRHVLLLLILRF